MKKMHMLQVYGKRGSVIKMKIVDHYPDEYEISTLFEKSMSKYTDICEGRVTSSCDPDIYKPVGVTVLEYWVHPDDL